MLDIIFGPVGSTILIVLVALAVVIAAILGTWRKIPSDKAAVIVGLAARRSSRAAVPLSSPLSSAWM